MTIRTILAPISGGGASMGAADAACRVAHRFGAHLEGLHIRQDPRMVVVDYGAGMPVSADFYDGLEVAEAETAKVAQAAFDEALAKYGLPRQNMPPLLGGKLLRIEASAEWRDETAVASQFIPYRARLFDLVVVGRSDRVEDKAHTDMLETLLLDGGRPLLIAPAKPPETLGESIALAWNGSGEAARALAAAMPFLRSTGKILILTTAPTEPSEGADVVRQLAWHGISAIARHVQTPEGVHVGDHLLSTARDEGADLLVMGGYGHAPWREMLFGGATRTILGASLLPILVAH